MKLANQHQTMAERHASLSRRRFLRGVGACMALPAFQSLLGSRAMAVAASPASALATTASGAPLRMAFVYIPNGVHQDNWWPTGEGKAFQFNRTMESIVPFRNDLQILAGLDHVNATAGPDGAGDHARATGTFLTGMRVKKTAGADVHAGISIDQVAVQQLGHLTRFPSVEMTCDATRKSGSCDSGYSCAYQHNLSWRSPTTPNAPEANPRLVFERLFGAGDAGQRKDMYKLRQQQQKSILDFIRDDASSLQGKLDSHDQHKLDEYLTSVREIEKRIEDSDRFGKAPDPGVATPAGIPGNFRDHVQVMYDMLLLAFQTDSTRIATLLLAGDGSNRPFPDIEIPEGHHSLSHHRGDATMMRKISEIDVWYMQEFSRFLGKMRDTKDVDGKPLLENSMILYGSGHSDGNRHTHVNLPLILAGSGGGKLTPGRFVQANAKPASNLFLSLADRMGVQGLKRFGDSTGRFDYI